MISILFVANNLICNKKNWDKILISNESNGREMNFGVVSQDPEETLRDFLAEFRVIQAAGGLVFNKEAQLLSILRNGMWDLPKGKIEKHEDQRAAALREVMEETGLNMINISEKIGATYHGYFEDNSVLIKKDVIPVSRSNRPELMKRLNLL